MKLKPRTTYLDGDGYRIAIAGMTRREKVDGQDCFWSISGNHYTEEGRFIHSRRVKGQGELVLESYTLPDYRRNLVSEDTSKEAKDWWIGVKTERDIDEYEYE